MTHIQLDNTHEQAPQVIFTCTAQQFGLKSVTRKDNPEIWSKHVITTTKKLLILDSRVDGATRILMGHQL
jgi:hypothetical protein